MPYSLKIRVENLADIIKHRNLSIPTKYGASGNDIINIGRNRIGQNLVEDDGSMVCKTKLLNQLGVTAPIESQHNLLETLNSERSEE